MSGVSIITKGKAFPSTFAFSAGSTMMTKGRFLHYRKQPCENDWTDNERSQIRDSLGIDGTKTNSIGGVMQKVETGVDTNDGKLDVIQLDLDSPDQYKASGFATPGEYDTEMARLDVNVSSRADENPPSQVLTDYKADISGLATSGSITALQTDVTFLKDVEGGRWEIIGTEMVFFKSDNITEIIRFSLLDKNGNPTDNNVYQRLRV